VYSTWRGCHLPILVAWQAASMLLRATWLVSDFVKGVEGTSVKRCLSVLSDSDSAAAGKWAHVVSDDDTVLYW